MIILRWVRPGRQSDGAGAQCLYRRSRRASVQPGPSSISSCFPVPGFCFPFGFGRAGAIFRASDESCRRNTRNTSLGGTLDELSSFAGSCCPWVWSAPAVPLSISVRAANPAASDELTHRGILSRESAVGTLLLNEAAGRAEENDDREVKAEISSDLCFPAVLENSGGHYVDTGDRSGRWYRRLDQRQHAGQSSSKEADSATGHGDWSIGPTCLPAGFAVHAFP